MSDVQLDEASISQGHSNSSICDRMCMFMCKCNESGFEITNQSEYLASFQTYCCAPPVSLIFTVELCTTFIV